MIDRYREMDVMTASPTTLVVKLYEGALRNALQARLRIEEGRIAERAQSIHKALAIVGELQGSLDFEKGGEIAVQLHDLYSFINQRLLDANLNASTQAVDDAVRVLETLLEGWQEVARNPGAQPTAGAPS